MFSLLGRNEIRESQPVFNIIAAGVVNCKHRKLTLADEAEKKKKVFVVE